MFDTSSQPISLYKNTKSALIGSSCAAAEEQMFTLRQLSAWWWCCRVSRSSPKTETAHLKYSVYALPLAAKKKKFRQEASVSTLKAEEEEETKI